MGSSRLKELTNKKALTDAEMAELEKLTPKKAYTDAELEAMAGMKLEDIPSPSAEAMKAAGSALGAMSDLADVGGAPTRAALMKTFQGKPTEAIGAAYDVLFGGPAQELSQRIRSAPDREDFAKLYSGSDKPGLGAEIAGFATEMFADPAQLVAPLARPIIKSFARRQGAKAAEKWLSRAMTMTDAKWGKDTAAMASQMVAEDLTKGGMFSVPSLTKKLTGGKSVNELKVAGISAFKSGKKGSGLIGEASNVVDDLIMSAHLDRSIKVPKTDISQNILLKIRDEMMSETSGVKYSVDDFNAMADELKDLLQKPGKKDTLNLLELRELKRNINKQLSSKEFFKTPSDAMARRKELLMDVVREVDDTIAKNLKGISVDFKGKAVDAGELYDLSNKRLKNLYDIAELLEKEEFKNLQGASLGEALFGAGVGGTTGYWVATATGMNPAVLTTLGAGGGAYNTLSRKSTMVAPQLSAMGMKAVEKGSDYVDLLPQVQRELRREDEGIFGNIPSAMSNLGLGRSPQSINKPILAQLPELAHEIIESRLPRSTDELFKNKKLFLAKVAQQAPQYFDIMQEAMKEGPEAVSELMTNPQIQIEMGKLFERDKYGSWDGVVIDPAKQNMYRKDIWDREDLDTLEKSEIIDQFNRTKRMPL